jgi:hypothetical protein
MSGVDKIYFWIVIPFAWIASLAAMTIAVVNVYVPGIAIMAFAILLIARRTYTPRATPI